MAESAHKRKLEVVFPKTQLHIDVVFKYYWLYLVEVFETTSKCWIFPIPKTKQFSKSFVKTPFNLSSWVIRIRSPFWTGRDSATFRDEVTEVSSLPRDKETSSKSCHGTGRNGIFDKLSRPVPGRPAGQNHFKIWTFLLFSEEKNIYIFFNFWPFFDNFFSI